MSVFHGDSRKIRRNNNSRSRRVLRKRGRGRNVGSHWCRESVAAPVACWIESGNPEVNKEHFSISLHFAFCFLPFSFPFLPFQIFSLNILPNIFSNIVRFFTKKCTRQTDSLHIPIFFFQLTESEIVENTWMPVTASKECDGEVSLPLRVPTDCTPWKSRSSTFFRRALLEPQSTLGSYPDSDGKNKRSFSLVSFLSFSILQTQ